MSPELIRVLGALGLAVVLAILAVTTRNQPFRRASLALGSLAMLLLSGYNAGPIYAFNSQPLAVAALVVLFAAIACYITSWLKGEVLKLHQQMSAEMAAKLKERRAAAAKRTTPKQ